MNMLLTWGEVFTVVLTGLVVVFVALILLIAVVWLYGNIFHLINNNKSNKTKITDTSPPSDNTPVSVIEEKVSESDGIPLDIIATITAAVVAFTGGSGVITGIKKTRVNNKRRSTEWANAGIISAMKKSSRVGW
jgi:Na+-transporting methylmalonyl-CoA/oxaloacetate decarboxylase gamma subunit